MTHTPNSDMSSGPYADADRPPGADALIGAVRHQLVGAKGGQGTTTVALALAALVAEHRLAAVSATRPADLAALAGVAPGDGPRTLAPQLHMVGPGDTPSGAVTVEDLGRLDELQAERLRERAPGTRQWLVLRGPCYLGLRAAVEAPWRPDGVVLVAEQGRALGVRDVAGVLGVDVVATVQVDPEVARIIDAGLLLAGPRQLRQFRYLARLVAPDLLGLAGRNAPTPRPAIRTPPAGPAVDHALAPATPCDITSLPAAAAGTGPKPERPRPHRRRL